MGINAAASGGLGNLFWIAFHNSYAPVAPNDGYFVAVGVILFVGNMIEVLQRQRDNRRAFSDARVAANKRLRRLEYLATHDDMTGLKNRMFFDAALEDALGKSDPDIAVVIVDLDRFKPINDTYGHDAGDEVLKRQARILREIAGPDIAARLGGDEFGLLVSNAQSRAPVLRRLQHLHAAMNGRMVHKGAEIDLGASLGIAFPDGERLSVAQICARADRAMYHAKQHDLEGPVIWDPSMDIDQPLMVRA